MNLPDFLINDAVLYLIRFMLGSTLILGTIYYLDKYRVFKSRELLEFLWKLGILATLLLLAPTNNPFRYQVPISITQDLNAAGQIVPVTNDVTFPRKVAESATETPPVSSNSSQPTENPTISTTKLAEQHSEYPLGILLVIAFAFAGLFITYYRALNSLGRRQRLDVSHHAFLSLCKICEKANIKSIPYITHSQFLDSPLCLPNGEICLPDWSLDPKVSRDKLTGLIAHEVAHLQRNDPIFLLVIHAVTRLLFIQPLLIVAQKRLADLAELAADEWAAQQVNDPKSVAAALYDCAHKISNKPQPQWGLAMAREKSIFRIRIETLLNINETKVSKTPFYHKLLFGLALISSSMLMPSFAFDSEENAEKENGRSRFHYRTDNGDGGFVLRHDISNGNTESGSLKINVGVDKFEAEWEGGFSFNESESSIAAMEKGASLIISEMSSGTTRSIEFNRKGGDVDVEFLVDGHAQSMSDDDKQWVKSSIIRFLRSSGVNVEQRTQRLLAKGGVENVVEEFASLRPMVMTEYLEQLLMQSEPSNPQLARLIELTGDIESDFAKRRALMLIASVSYLNDDNLSKTFDSAKDIDSDFELRKFLNSVFDKRELSEDLISHTLKLSQSIESDFELRHFLIKAMEKDNLTDEHAKLFIQRAKDNIASDFELRSFMTNYIDTFSDSRDAMSNAISLLPSISSDFELTSAISYLANNAELEFEDWKSLINVADEIDSDYETAKVAEVLVKKMPSDQELLKGLKDMVKRNIGSRSQRQRVLNKISE